MKIKLVEVFIYEQTQNSEKLSLPILRRSLTSAHPVSSQLSSHASKVWSGLTQVGQRSSVEDNSH